MRFDIITIFPEVFKPYFDQSIIGRAQKKKLAKINLFDLRDYTVDRHRTVDDRPYGGGAGMVLMVEPIHKAIKCIKRESRVKKSKIILLSAKGKKFDQKMAQRFSKLDQLIIISGRYEGVDERVAKYVADAEVSIGDYVLTGGELPAMIIVDATVRLIDDVITKDSLKEESFSKEKYIEYPHYTRPESIIMNGKKRGVPRVLISGNHQEIRKWQTSHSKRG